MMTQEKNLPVWGEKPRKEKRGRGKPRIDGAEGELVEIRTKVSPKVVEYLKNLSERLYGKRKVSAMARSILHKVYEADNRKKEDTE